ncbi:hypothetical protein GCM10008940_15100 [Microbulbifer agarilyticus]
MAENASAIRVRVRVRPAREEAAIQSSVAMGTIFRAAIHKASIPAARSAMYARAETANTASGADLEVAVDGEVIAISDIGVLQLFIFDDFGSILARVLAKSLCRTIRQAVTFSTTSPLLIRPSPFIDSGSDR